MGLIAVLKFSQYSGEILILTSILREREPGQGKSHRRPVGLWKAKLEKSMYNFYDFVVTFPSQLELTPTSNRGVNG